MSRLVRLASAPSHAACALGAAAMRGGRVAAWPLSVLTPPCRCAFHNCQHLAEPGCVVRGEWERYPLYCDIHAELRVLEEVDSQRAAGCLQQGGGQTWVAEQAAGAGQ